MTLDAVRRFWDRRPCNERHSPQPIGTRAYFDEVDERRYRVESHIRRFAQFARWRGKRVLEIGSGIGTDAFNFARAGAAVTCVELSPVSLALCQQRFDVCGPVDHQSRFYCADAELLSKTVPVEPYDLIYSFGVLHHTPHPVRALVELQQYCNTETELRVMLYAKYSYKVLWLLLRYGHGAFWRLNEIVAQHSEAETGCPVTFCYSSAGARELFVSAGFHVTSVRKAHIFPYRIRAYVQYRYEKVWYFRMLPLAIFRWLERHFGWHLLITARLNNEQVD